MLKGEAYIDQSLKEVSTIKHEKMNFKTIKKDTMDKWSEDTLLIIFPLQDGPSNES